jgi:hypothetical protein
VLDLDEEVLVVGQPHRRPGGQRQPADVEAPPHQRRHQRLGRRLAARRRQRGEVDLPAPAAAHGRRTPAARPPAGVSTNAVRSTSWRRTISAERRLQEPERRGGRAAARCTGSCRRSSPAPRRWRNHTCSCWKRERDRRRPDAGDRRRQAVSRRRRRSPIRARQRARPSSCTKTVDAPAGRSRSDSRHPGGDAGGGERVAAEGEQVVVDADPARCRGPRSTSAARRRWRSSSGRRHRRIASTGRAPPGSGSARRSTLPVGGSGSPSRRRRRPAPGARAAVRPARRAAARDRRRPPPRRRHDPGDQRVGRPPSPRTATAPRSHPGRPASAASTSPSSTRKPRSLTCPSRRPRKSRCRRRASGPGRRCGRAREPGGPKGSGTKRSAVRPGRPR